jgi:hypothetical protein
VTKKVNYSLFSLTKLILIGNRLIIRIKKLIIVFNKILKVLKKLLAILDKLRNKSNVPRRVQGSLRKVLKTT